MKIELNDEELEIVCKILGGYISAHTNDILQDAFDPTKTEKECLKKIEHGNKVLKIMEKFLGD